VLEPGLKTRDNSNFLIEPNSGSEVMLIAFAGNGGRLGMPIFEFFNILSDVPATKVFLKDPNVTWYQDGVPGFGDDVLEVAENIKKLALENGARKIVTIGNSAGGYAAILFGVLIGADNVLAFSPNTKITREDDSYFPETLRQMLAASQRSSPFFRNLRQVILKYNTKSRIYAFYSQFDRFDERHISNISDLDSVRNVGYPSMFHNLIRVFKDLGLLKGLILSSLEGEVSIPTLGWREKTAVFTLSAVHFSSNKSRKLFRR
jgi:hypothetical protein